MMAFDVGSLFVNIWLWIGLTFFFLILLCICAGVMLLVKLKTHAFIELKAWASGRNIALFFGDNRYCEWKPVKNEAGIIIDDKYGAYIVNERATYIDRATKAVLIPFDASIGASVNVKAAKLADELQNILHDEQQFREFRVAIAKDQIKDDDSLNCLKTSIHFGAIKNMMTALIPHNVNAKIQMEIAKKLKSANLSNTIMMIYIMIAMVAGGALVLVAQHFSK